MGLEDFPLPSSKSFSIATFQNCMENHGKCRVNNEPWHPTRLIQITWDDTIPSLRLVDGTEIQSGSRYVALSHCWGDGSILKLTTENIDDTKEYIPQSQLPKTFQDAVLIAGWLKGYSTLSILGPCFVLCFLFCSVVAR